MPSRKQIRVCFATSYDDAYQPLGELCIQSIQKYTQIFGYDYRVIRGRKSDREHGWDKLIIIEELLNEGFEYVFWLDADTLIVRFDRDIADEIVEDKDVYITIHTHHRHPMPGVHTQREFPSAGMYLVKNSPGTRQFLSRLYQFGEGRQIRFQDNAALLEAVGYFHWLDSSLQNVPDPEIWKHIQVLDYDWNSIKNVPYVPPSPNPIVLHYAGQRPDQRLFSMQVDFERYVQGYPQQLRTDYQYDFRTPYDGIGWYAEEFSPESNVWFRWSALPEASLYVPLIPGLPYKISFQILYSLIPENFGRFALTINHQPIALEREARSEGYAYAGSIPAEVSAETGLRSGEMIVTFAVPEIRISASMDVDNPHPPRELGIAVADLKITLDKPKALSSRNKLSSLNQPLNLAIVTAYDEKYRDAGELCSAGIQRYAERYGYETRFYTDSALSQHAAYKLDILERAFSEGFEWIFWLDADALFCDFMHDIGDEIAPEKHIYLACQTVIHMPMYGVRRKVDVPNTGVMLLHNVPFTHELLARVRANLITYKDMPSENRTFNHLLGYKAKHPSKIERNTVDPELRRHIKFLNPRWNVVKGLPLLEAVSDPIILHYQDQPYEQRLRVMREDFRRNMTNVPAPRVRSVNYDFAQPYDGDGWYPSQSANNGLSYRWTGRLASTLHFPLSAETDYAVRFEIVSVAAASVLDGFRLTVNDVLIYLERTPAETEGNWIYSGIIPRHAPGRRGDSEVILAFCVDELRSPSEFDPEADARHLGVAIADLRIVPIASSSPEKIR